LASEEGGIAGAMFTINDQQQKPVNENRRVVKLGKYCCSMFLVTTGVGDVLADDALHRRAVTAPR
jgi:hypothetical protein